SLFISLLTACGGGGGGDDKKNQAPVADAGDNFEVAVNTQNVALDGSKSNDPDGDSITYAWTPAEGLSDATAAKPTFTAPEEAGVLTFELVVTDANGEASAPDSVQVTVVAEDTTPDAFSFNERKGVRLDSEAISNAITVEGINAPSPIAVTDGEYSIKSESEDWGEFTDAPGTVEAGRQVRMKLKAANDFYTPRSAELNIGGEFANFTATTTGVLHKPRALDYDPVRKLVFGIDASLKLIFALDPVTGDRTLVSGNDGTQTRGTGVSFDRPGYIAVDGDRLLVTDGFGDLGKDLDAVIAVDIASGDRTVFSDDNDTATEPPPADPQIGKGPGFYNMSGIAIDRKRNQVLVVDTGDEKVIAVDLETGDRNIISDDSHNGPTLNNLRSVAVDGDRALITDRDADGFATVIAVDLKEGGTQGTRTLISGNGEGDGPEFGVPRGIVLDGERALVTDTAWDLVFAVDLREGETQGDREVISNEHIPDDGDIPQVGQGPGFAYPLDITMADGNILVADLELNAVVAVSREGDRSEFAHGGRGAGPSFTNPRSVVVDATGEKAYVLDDFWDAVFEVDLTTGNRTVLSDYDLNNDGDPDDHVGDGPGFGSPKRITLDNRNNPRALVVDYDMQAVIAVDLDTGNRTVISDDNDSATDPVNPVEVGTGLGFFNPISVVAGGNQAFVSDDAWKSVMKVNLDNGAREVLSDKDLDDNSSTVDPKGSGPEFIHPMGIAFNNGQLLVVDNGLDAVIDVDLATGNRKIVSDLVNDVPDRDPDQDKVGDGPGFVNPISISINADGTRALVVDEALDAVFAVDLNEGVIKGNRMVLSDHYDEVTDPDNPAQRGSGPRFFSPRDISVDGSRALVVDGEWDALFEVDLITGDRKLISK
ncbi:MAG: PKD domain-containing protein, partial [Gammaproteobacteria bacterium]|nr:PKD domain-containing protein [Gammaproteobacteria bacterium]